GRTALWSSGCCAKLGPGYSWEEWCCLCQLKEDTKHTHTHTHTCTHTHTYTHTHTHTHTQTHRHTDTVYGNYYSWLPHCGAKERKPGECHIGWVCKQSRIGWVCKQTVPHWLGV